MHEAGKVVREVAQGDETDRAKLRRAKRLFKMPAWSSGRRFWSRDPRSGA
jgi:hypothetical protein